jgi:hypothetical protein
MTITTLLEAELRAVTYPLRRRTRFGLHALANDALSKIGKPPRFEETYAEQWSRILDRSQAELAQLPAATGPRVLFGTMFGASFPTRAIDSIIAMALRLRGVTPWILACDMALPGCEWNVFGTSPQPGARNEAQVGRHGREYACKACMVKLGESHALPGLERVSLSSFMQPDDASRALELAAGVELAELRDFSYAGINVGEHTYASLLRALMRGIPKNDEPTRVIARRLLRSAIMLVDAGKQLFDALRPDRFVAGEVYLTAGPLCELARQRGIHVVVHGQPYRKQTVWVSHDESYHRALINEKNDRWQKFEMSESRNQIADDYLKSKHFVARDYTTYHVDSIQDEAAIRAELGLDQRPIVSLFTNVLWDAQLYYRFNVFPTMLDWLYETIRHFEKRPDLQLVIRVHPAEAPGGLPTNQPLLPELEREFPTLPANVALVRPESKVSSYVLGTMSSAALVYGARMGVELVMLGTPVVVAGEAFMRGKGFTLDPATRDEYFAILERGGEIPKPTPEERALARRWYYYYFFRMMMPFPFYAVEKAGSEALVRLTFESLADLRPGRSPVLDLVCQGIVDGRAPFEWDEFDGPAPPAA